MGSAPTRNVPARTRGSGERSNVGAARAGADVDVTGLAADLRLVIGRLARRLRQQSDTTVSASMLSALWTVEGRGPITLGDLAAAESVQPPTITRVAARLEEADLVRRVVDPSDRRVSRVELTGAGRRLLDRARSRRTAYLARHLAGLSAQDRAALERSVRILQAVLGEDR